jgi:hypothetical protein
MVMPPQLVALGEHALQRLAQSQGVADLYVIYVQAQRAGAVIRAAWIADEFEAMVRPAVRAGVVRPWPRTGASRQGLALAAARHRR